VARTDQSGDHRRLTCLGRWDHRPTAT